METSGKVVVAKYFSAQCPTSSSLSTFSRTSTKIICAGFPNYLLLVAPVNWVVEVYQETTMIKLVIIFTLAWKLVRSRKYLIERGKATAGEVDRFDHYVTDTQTNRLCPVRCQCVHRRRQRSSL